MACASKRRRVSEGHSTTYLLNNPKSKLATRPLDALFREEVWELLSPDRREACLALLPAIDKNEEQESGLCEGFWMGNVCLQEALRDFQSDLAEGRFMPQYRRRVERASKQRLEGKADAWKEGQFELFCQHSEEERRF